LPGLPNEARSFDVSYLDQVRAYHREHIEPLLGAARGCEAREVDALERALGFALPAAYREFLLWMGRDLDGAFRGSDCFVDHVRYNNEWLPKLLAENDVGFPLPERFVAFFMHQGYVAAWFAIPAEPDPACWLFAEGNSDVPEELGPFSSWLLKHLQGLVPAIRSVHGDGGSSLP